MRRIAIRILAAGTGIMIVWLFAGRRLTLLMDRIITVRETSLPVGPPIVEGGSVRIGERSLPLEPFREPPFPFTPEPLDEAWLTIEHSALSWPTPFQFNFMTGQSPSWKRHMYYRLIWKKPSGAKLEMLWRYEQWFYSAFGWASGAMIREGSTGLIRVRPI